MEQVRELFQIAEEETKHGNIHKAIEAYKKIIKQSEEKDQAMHLSYWGIGEIYLNQKQYNEAENNLKKAIELKSDEPIYHYLLGCTYTYMKKIDEAIHHLEKAVSYDDTRDIYWGQLGWVVGFNKDSDKGIEYLKKSIKINPLNTRSLKDICMLYTKNRKFREALVCIEEAIEHEPDNPELHKIKNNVEHFHNEFKRLSE